MIHALVRIVRQEIRANSFTTETRRARRCTELLGPLGAHKVHKSVEFASGTWHGRLARERPDGMLLVLRATSCPPCVCGEDSVRTNPAVERGGYRATSS